jgi:hypothetical protein
MDARYKRGTGFSPVGHHAHIGWFSDINQLTIQCPHCGVALLFPSSVTEIQGESRCENVSCGKPIELKNCENLARTLYAIQEIRETAKTWGVCVGFKFLDPRQRPNQG